MNEWGGFTSGEANTAVQQTQKTQPFACNDGDVSTICISPTTFTPWVTFELPTQSNVSSVRLYGATCQTTEGAGYFDPCRYALAGVSIIASDSPITDVPAAVDGIVATYQEENWHAHRFTVPAYVDIPFTTNVTTNYITLRANGNLGIGFYIAELEIMGVTLITLQRTRVTAQLGRALYGPGVCTITANCASYARPNIDNCNTRTPLARFDAANGVCVCNDPCISAPLCTDWVDTRSYKYFVGTTAFTGTCAKVTSSVVSHNKALRTSGHKLSVRVPCGQFGPSGCGPTMTCSRSSQIEICCPLGYAGSSCNTPIGCSQGCMNGGICNLHDENGVAFSIADTSCVSCNRGWSGRFCNVAITQPHISTVLTRTIGNITYGPGLCGVTVDCTVSPGSGITTGVYGQAVCDLVVEDATPRTWGRTPCECTAASCYMDSLICTGRSASCEPIPDSCGDIPGGCSGSGTCVHQNFTGNRVVNQDGPSWFIKAQSICCPRGWIGNSCEIVAGCEVSGCDHGGQCLTHDARGNALAPADTKCFGCDAGWGGEYCEVANTPTFTVVEITNPGRRRLLQSTQESVRTSNDRNTQLSGAIFREPSRVCDCAVKWDHAPAAAFNYPIMLMGNYSSDADVSGVVSKSTTAPGEVVPALLSPIRYDTIATPIDAVWTRRVRSHDEAMYQCAADWLCYGYFFSDMGMGDGYIGSVAFFSREYIVPDGQIQMQLGDKLGFPHETHIIERVEDAGLCPSANMDSEHYCRTYPSQCRSIIEAGGAGNIRIAPDASIDVIANLHFRIFGHKIRNSPNADCSLVSQWAEDETGCTRQLAAPRALYPVEVNSTLTAEVCGAVSRIDQDRIFDGQSLVPGFTTGTNITDAGVSQCLCSAPFAPNNPSSPTDCAYDLCGFYNGRRVDGRGLVNADPAASLVDACVCNGLWGTDPDSCTGTQCKWCAATACQNYGVVQGSNYTAGCACIPIFTGFHCETSLCNATNTLTGEFNITKWEGYNTSDIVCDCKKEWTGALCNDPQCIHGSWNYVEETCDCNAGYSGEQCQIAYCIESHGLWDGNATHGACECVPPWSGATCEEHSCDWNPVLNDAGWDGMRPFGQPIVRIEGGWECECNFPYGPTASSTTGYPTNCANNQACNHGRPNANASSIVNPRDACTCKDPKSIGITTDPKHCTGFNLTACPNMCAEATCSLSQDDIDQVGYVDVPKGDDDADAGCCMCDASVGYHITGKCMPFCQLVQPCLTTNTSHFLGVTVVNNVTVGNFTYEQVGMEWKCKCDAFWSSVDPSKNDCSAYTAVVNDAIPNEDDLDNGAGGNNQNGESSSSSSSSSTSLDSAQIGAIAAAGAAVLLFLGSQWAQYVTNKAVEKGIDVVFDKATATTTKGRAAGVVRAGEHVRLIMLVMLLGLVTVVQAVPFLYPDTLMWNTISTSRCRSILNAPGGEVSFQIGPDVAGLQVDRNGWLEVRQGGDDFIYTYHDVQMFPADRYIQSGAGPAIRLYTIDGDNEFTYSFTGGVTGATARIGEANMPVNSLSWSAMYVKEEPSGMTENSSPFFFSLNICYENNFNCGHGTCVSKDAFASVTGGGFPSCATQSDFIVDVVRTPRRNFEIMRYVPTKLSRFNVRGCKCFDSYYGLKCQSECPDIASPLTAKRDLCSGHGTCKSGLSITHPDDWRTCMCKPTNGIGCECDQGYTGDRCEIAVQTRKPFFPDIVIVPAIATHPENVVMTDFSRCCPADSTDCSPMSVPEGFPTPAVRTSPYGFSLETAIPYTYTPTCTPTQPCPSGETCGCTSVDPALVQNRGQSAAMYGYSDLLSNHIKSQRMCGEDYVITTDGWYPGFPEEGSDRITTGTGKCWLGKGWTDYTGATLSKTEAYCICNNPNIFHPNNGTKLMNAQKRGWFGSNCQYRTCTRRTGVKVPMPRRTIQTPGLVYNDNGGQATTIDFVNSTNDVQCSGRAHGWYNGKTVNYDSDETPCDDKAILWTNGSYTNLNTPGRCKACDEGWGLYKGYSVIDIAKAGYDATDFGICSERTMHSSGGGQCGGYGRPVVRSVLVEGVNGNASLQLNRVDSCECNEGWGLKKYADSQLCQRSCAQGVNPTVLPENVTDAYGWYLPRYNQTYYASTKDIRMCGGYSQGLCRPITYGSRPDGFNSACMCNIGYAGPECTKVESMWHKGSVCGVHGQSTMRPTPADMTPYSTKYVDEYWFNKYIVPLDREQITAPENAHLYSIYQCECSAAKAGEGWAPDTNGICAPTCSAAELMGNDSTSICSSHGTCIDDPLNPGKMCQCDLGWAGANCGTKILHDRLDQPCGGTDRGTIEYTNSNKTDQYCRCNTPYVTSPYDDQYRGLCWKPCPNACSGVEQGRCERDTDPDNKNGANNGNDDVCTCTPDAFTGKDCSQKLVAAYVTKSGRNIACTGHGRPDDANNGFCSCLPDWVGFACEIYVSSRQCGTGQTFQDNESLGIAVG